MCFFFKYLVDEGLYESEEDTMRREEVLGRIDQVCFFVDWFFLCLIVNQMTIEL